MTPIEWCRFQQAAAKKYIDDGGACRDGAMACIRDCLMEEVILLTRERDDDNKTECGNQKTSDRMA